MREEGIMEEEGVRKKKVLFICTHNSARSQMAEGLMNALLGRGYEAQSAGVDPTGVDPLAVRVMGEIGIDISNHRAKHISRFRDARFDYAVAVCDRARESCPFFPAETVIHRSFEDPASSDGTDGERLRRFREVRDEIRGWLLETFGLESE